MTIEQKIKNAIGEIKETYYNEPDDRDMSDVDSGRIRGLSQALDFIKEEAEEKIDEVLPEDNLDLEAGADKKDDMAEFNLEAQRLADGDKNDDLKKPEFLMTEEELKQKNDKTNY